MAPGTVSRVIRALLFSVAGLIAALALTVGTTAATTPACSACHKRTTPDLMATSTQTAHASVACEACHVPADGAGKVEFASRQVFGMTLRLLPDDVTRPDVPDSRCLSCHEKALAGVVSANGIRFKHDSCAQGSRCVDCHSGSAHGTASRWIRDAEMTDCLSCHTTKKVSEKCDTCHAERGKRERLVLGTWAKTHGARWKTTHGMGELGTCSACHPSDYCSRCHGIELPHQEEYVTVHSAEATRNRASCTSCHDTAVCDSCHGLAMPHDRRFTRDHISIVRRKGETACLRCHDKADCTECHTRHVHPVDIQQIDLGALE